jgi:hypothetical protein
MKESFLIYKSHYDAIVHELSNEEKGILFDAICEYNFTGTISDLPLSVRLVFNFMKSQFDRDNKKYEAICERNRENGLKGGRPENPKKPKQPTGLSGNPKKPKKPDTDTDTDTDTDPEYDFKNKEKFSFKKSLINLGIEEKIVTDWLLVRKNKKAANTQTAFKHIKNEIEKSGLSANECIKIATQRSWQGFEAKYLNGKKSLSGMQTGQILQDVNYKSKVNF